MSRKGRRKKTPHIHKDKHAKLAAAAQHARAELDRRWASTNKPDETLATTTLPPDDDTSDRKG